MCISSDALENLSMSQDNSTQKKPCHGSASAAEKSLPASSPLSPASNSNFESKWDGCNFPIKNTVLESVQEVVSLSGSRSEPNLASLQYSNRSSTAATRSSGCENYKRACPPLRLKSEAALGLSSISKDPMQSGENNRSTLLLPQVLSQEDSEPLLLHPADTISELTIWPTSSFGSADSDSRSENHPVRERSHTTPVNVLQSWSATNTASLV